VEEQVYAAWPFLVLGVETSCDETAAAVVGNGVAVLSSVVSSQVDLHARFGGVVPEIASRAHLELVNPVIAQALVESGLALSDIGAVAACADTRQEQALRHARQVLGPDRARAAKQRGAAMSMAAAAEYALMLTAPAPPPAPAAPGSARLSARERELVTLVAQGRTDADIAARLYISIRTVRSHLDRIRDKTGCRRRADLTRLALVAGLV